MIALALDSLLLGSMGVVVALPFVAYVLWRVWIARDRSRRDDY